MHVEIAWSWNQKNGEVSAVYAWRKWIFSSKEKIFLSKEAKSQVKTSSNFPTERKIQSFDLFCFHPT